jgi:hypothetical protein
MNLRLVPSAGQEMFRSAHWYDDHQEGLGDRFLDAIQVGFKAIRRQPQSFSPVTAIGLRREVRR